MNITLKNKNGVVLHTAKKYCEEDIEINVKAEELNITPNTEEQVKEGLFEKVTVARIAAEELNIKPSTEEQTFNGLYGNVNVDAIQTEEKIIDVNFSNADTIETIPTTGKYIKKTIINKDTDLKPENIKTGINIFGIEGGFSGTNTSDATATAGDILKDKTAYINGEKVIGTIEEYNGAYTGNSETSNGATNEWEEIFKSSIDKTYGLNVTKLPEGITTLIPYAFYGCTKLALTKLPDELTAIGQRAFVGCSNLELTELPSGLTSLDANAFERCTKLNINELPSGITQIKTYTFYSCKALTSLKILGNITKIEDRAFYGCDNLQKIILPNVTSVPSITAYSIAVTPIANKTGYIYVPDSLVDSFKTASYWSTYADQIKPISEMEG